MFYICVIRLPYNGYECAKPLGDVVYKVIKKTMASEIETIALGNLIPVLIKKLMLILWIIL